MLPLNEAIVKPLLGIDRLSSFLIRSKYNRCQDESTAGQAGSGTQKCRFGGDILHALRQQLLHHFAVHVGQAEVAALEAVGQPGVVEAQQVQDRGVQVVDVDAIFDGVEAELVGARPA